MSLLHEILRRVLPDPIEVISHDLGLAVDNADVTLAQKAWCREWRRDPIDGFRVHDALHYLLDCPPTPVGETTVIMFQRQHGILDRDLMGAGAILFAFYIVKERAVAKRYLRDAEKRWGKARGRLARLRGGEGA